MIDFGNLIRRLGRLDGHHWLEIRRRVGGQDVSVYPLPVRCWVSVHSQDNPDPVTVFTTPVVTSLLVFTFPEVDIQNGDFLILQKTNADTGALIGAYRGLCGFPASYQPFQRVNVQMAALGTGDLPMPPPLPGESIIHVHFLNEGHQRIHDSIMHRAPIGEPMVIPFLDLPGFEFDHIVMDGDRVDTDVLEFTPEKESYNVTFFYVGQMFPTAVKPLINSIFTTASGAARTGWHLYNNIPAEFIEERNMVVYMRPEVLRWRHDTSFRWLSFNTFDDINNVSIVVLWPQMDWRRIVDIEGGVLALQEFEPSEEQRNSYVIPF